MVDVTWLGNHGTIEMKGCFENFDAEEMGCMRVDAE